MPQLGFPYGVPLTPTFSSNTITNEDSLNNSYLKSQSSRELKRQKDTISSTLTSRDSHSTDTSCGTQATEHIPLKVRGGAIRRPTGYQPELVCQIPWINSQVPERITALGLNSAFGIIAIGTANGVALVDIVTSTLIYAWANAELYGRDGIPTSSHTTSFDSQVFFNIKFE